MISIRSSTLCSQRSMTEAALFAAGKSRIQAVSKLWVQIPMHDGVYEVFCACVTLDNEFSLSMEPNLNSKQSSTAFIFETWMLFHKNLLTLQEDSHLALGQGLPHTNMLSGVILIFGAPNTNLILQLLHSFPLCSTRKQAWARKLMLPASFIDIPQPPLLGQIVPLEI